MANKATTFLFFIGIYGTETFRLIPNVDHQGALTVDLGQSFNMTCRADNHYEYCTFMHNGNKVSVINSIDVKFLWHIP